MVSWSKRGKWKADALIRFSYHLTNHIILRTKNIAPSLHIYIYTHTYIRVCVCILILYFSFMGLASSLIQIQLFIAVQNHSFCCLILQIGESLLYYLNYEYTGLY